MWVQEWNHHPGFQGNLRQRGRHHPRGNRVGSAFQSLGGGGAGGIKGLVGPWKFVLFTEQKNSRLYSSLLPTYSVS